MFALPVYWVDTGFPLTPAFFTNKSMSILDKFPSKDEILENAKDTKDSLYDYEDNPNGWTELSIVIIAIIILGVIYYFLH